MIELWHVLEINGKPVEIEYNYRRTEFKDYADLEKYKMYLEKLLNKRLYLIYRDKTKIEHV